MSNKKIRTRFAPSPTGYLHVGSLRTALYSYLVARQSGGDFLLRIEDTDRERFVEGSVENLIKVLNEVGIDYDEGPYLEKGELKQKGSKGPYFQSERLDIYKKSADQLVAEGKAYVSFKSSEELEEIKKKLQENKRPLKRADLNEDFNPEEVSKKIAQGERYVLRLQTPTSGKITFTDLIREEVTFDYSEIDDFIIMKSDGYPTYHLASVIDDTLMEISHVIRAEEWLSSTPKHLLLYDALNFEVPQFAHLPLLLNPDKSKLSKRQGDVSVEDYLQKGYLSDALLNFVAMLGWNPGEGSTQEVFSVKELIEAFKLENVHKAGAVFDITKLNWLNGKYLREQMTLDEFLKLANPLIAHDLAHSKNLQTIFNDHAKREMLGKMIRERVDYLSQIHDFFQENSWLADKLPEYPIERLAWKKSTLEAAQKVLAELVQLLGNIDEKNWTAEYLEAEIKKWIAEKGFNNGEVLWPMRVALSGQEKSPTPFEIAAILGKDASIDRLSKK